MKLSAEQSYRRFLIKRAQHQSALNHWAKVARYVSPDLSDVTAITNEKGSEKRNDLLNPHAAIAADKLIGFIVGETVDPKMDWLGAYTSSEELNNMPSFQIWLGDTIHQILSILFSSSFYDEYYSMVRQLVTFGNATTTAYIDPDKNLIYETHPIPSMIIHRGKDGSIIESFVPENYTIEELILKFPELIIPQEIKDAVQYGHPTNYHIIRHSFKNSGALKDESISSRFKWGDRYLLASSGAELTRNTNTGTAVGMDALLRQLGDPTGRVAQIGITRGWEYCPYFSPYWEKVPGEELGRSPAMKALPLSRISNRIYRDVLAANERTLSMPLAVNMRQIDPSFVEQLSKNQILPVTDDPRNAVLPISIAPDLAVGWESLEFVHNQISLLLFEDEINLYKTGRQTATEIAERAAGRAKILSPLINPLIKHGIMPAVRVAYEAGIRSGKITPPDPKFNVFFNDKKINIHFYLKSPLANIQKLNEVASYARFAELIGLFAQFDQNIVDNINTDVVSRDIAKAIGVPPRFMRPVQEVDQIRQERARMMQRQQQQQDQQIQAGIANEDLKARATMLKSQAAASKGIAETSGREIGAF